MNPTIDTSILEPKALSKRSAHALAAHNIRKTLKKLWPKTKFSVTSDSFSMGNSVRVSWVDGPSAPDVDAIVKQWAGGYFDGMQDIYEYRDNAINSHFGEAKYVSTQRRVSGERQLEIARELGIEASLDAGGNINTPNFHDSERIWRHSRERSY